MLQSYRYTYNQHISRVITWWGGSPHGVMVKVLDFGLKVSNIELLSRYYIHFQTYTLRKNMNPLILPAMGWLVLLPFFYKGCFNIEYPTKVDILLNKETKTSNYLSFGWFLISKLLTKPNKKIFWDFWKSLVIMAQRFTKFSFKISNKKKYNLN